MRMRVIGTNWRDTRAEGRRGEVGGEGREARGGRRVRAGRERGGDGPRRRRVEVDRSI
jgi:hypothetical protein